MAMSSTAPMTSTTAVLLASASPRRRELLQQIGVPYRIVSHDVIEVRQAGESAQNFVMRMAREKALSALYAVPADHQPVVLGADTVVVCDDLVMGKPADRDEAVGMLTRLSGREHRVLSAVAVASCGVVEVAISETTVGFRDITAQQIEQYWLTGEPRDKAGAYAIQGLGGIFVKTIRGSYTGVVGLPLYETALLLAKFNVPCWQRVSSESDRQQ